LTSSLLDRMGPGQDVRHAWLLTGESGLVLDEDPARALELSRQSLALKERALGPDNPDVGRSLADVSEDQHRLGRNEEALANNLRAQDIAAHAYGPATPEITSLLSNEGEVLVALGRAREAVPIFEHALELWPAGEKGDQMFVAFPLTGLGQAHLALGQPARALAPLERALRLREGGNDPAPLSETRFALARALWDSRGDRARARRLAEEARAADARAAGPEAKAEAERIDAWLASHRH
jgi:tetratricopeptide (TPR) repeat protein